MDIYVKISFIFIFSLFLAFKHDFIICVDITRIAASNTTSDDVTKMVIHRIFNTDLLYSCHYFIVKIDEKFSLNDGFNTI